ncbi:MAG TPA: arylsulfotransferase family protein [Solirubrobacteraceae bacterium]|nr:arylsulfotransferase family protein [Solirubrobacteraceae bacterium]
MTLIRVLKRSPRLAGLAVALSLATAASAQAAGSPGAGTYTTHGAWSFASAPNLHPPKLHMGAKPATKGLSRGLFFVSNFVNITSGKPSTGQGGPLILDSHLQPVWFLPVAGLYANNLRVQTYNGKPALSWWEGLITNQGVTTQGTDYVVDQHYHQVATLTAPADSGWVITQHEMIIQGHDAWVTANSAQPVTVNGQKIIDSAVLEFDLSKPGSEPIYSWVASQHIPLSASQQPAPPFPGAAWDAYHINSIQLVTGGFVVSMRNTWSAYRVDKASGNIVWTLDGSGKGGSFQLPANGHFAWQHDVELHSNGLVTLFDDECCQLTYNPKSPFAQPEGTSRGLLLRLNTKTGTASYVHEYVHPLVHGNTIVETAFQGNMQLEPNGNMIVGWGSSPFSAFTEFSYSGHALYDAVLPAPDVSYRGYLFGWVGKPPASLMREVVKKSHGKWNVYASWDGATEVVAWRVLGGSSAKHLRVIASRTRTGFETAIRLKHPYNVYKVQAIDRHGHVLGTSKAFRAAAKVGPPTCFYTC